MASTLFRGGVIETDTLATKWVSAASLNASLVTTISSISPTWTKLSEFTAVNTLVGAQQPLPGGVSRAVGWGDDKSTGKEGLEFKATGQVTFTGVAGSTPIAGIVVYDGSTADPTNAKLWFVDQQSFVTAGGDVKWGDAGLNVLFRLRPRNSTQVFFRGGLQDLYTRADSWASLAGTYGFALVSSTGLVVPQYHWNVLDDLWNAGVRYVAGGSPGHANMPTKTVVGGMTPDRITTYNSSLFEYRHVLNNTGDITWTYAGNMTAGQTIAAVIMFRWTGETASSPVYTWDDVPNTVIVLNQNVVYGDVGSTSRAIMAIDLG